MSNNNDKNPRSDSDPRFEDEKIATTGRPEDEQKLKNEKKRPPRFGKTVAHRMLVGGQSEEEREFEQRLSEQDLVESPGKVVWDEFKSRPTAILGLCIIIFLFVLCFIGPLFWPVDIYLSDPMMQNIKPGYVFLKIPSDLKKNPRAISNGNKFGVGITEDGKISLWGHYNEKMERDIPELEDGEEFVDLEVGSTHILALTNKGQVYTWGDNGKGLTQVPRLPGEAKLIHAGENISGLIDDKGQLHFWGATLNMKLRTPRALGTRYVAKDFAFTENTAIVLTEDGDAVVLDTGRGNIYGDAPEETVGRTIDIAAAEKNVFALTEDGRLHVWGQHSELSKVPEDIQGHIVEITAGLKHAVARLDDGTLRAWGLDNYGQTDVPSSAKNVKEVQANYHGTTFITEDGSADAFGHKGYLMGSDENGRDLFTRLIFGGRMSLTVGAVAVIISAIIGVIIGGIAGYYGGWVDTLLMRVAEVFYAIPFLPLAMILSAVIQNRVSQTGRIVMIMVIMGILSWPGLARLTRAQILSVREQEYVVAAKALGIPESRTIFKHILPNVINVVLVSITLSFATSILTESTLSFLGFGVTLPTPTWGNIVYAASNAQAVANYWWRWFFPSLALALATISINMIGDSLRDAIDPKHQAR